jgi:cytoskeletal protein CcmA (bactofilin family)
LRIWQYQDFEGPYSNPLRLSDFQNGKQTSFNQNFIVDGTAVAVNTDTYNGPPKVSTGLTGLFSKKISVNQHVRDTVFLDFLPDENQKIRIYYLIVLPDGINVPLDYEPPTEYVRKSRIEYFDAVDIDSGGAKSIFGEKVFNNKLTVKDDVVLNKSLQVESNISCDKLSVSDGAVNGYVLTSNAVGNTTWLPNPVVDSVPPTNSFRGRVWIKTPEYVSFIFDGIREKWTAQDSFCVEGSKNTTSCANVYMNGIDNISHEVNSVVLPFDAVLVGLIATGQEKQSWIAEVHSDNQLIGSSVLHVVNSTCASVMNLDVNFKSGQKIQLFASGSGIVMPYIRAIFKQRV